MCIIFGQVHYANMSVNKTRVFGTEVRLNSRLNPNTSASKMAPGRYDPVYEEGSQDYPLPYILARSCLNPNMEAYLKLLADKRITLRNLNPKATYSTVRIRS
jgi:hypothetical protein